jgi:hypothetical protein
MHVVVGDCSCLRPSNRHEAAGWRVRPGETLVIQVSYACAGRVADTATTSTSDGLVRGIRCEINLGTRERETEAGGRRIRHRRFHKGERSSVP